MVVGCLRLGDNAGLFQRHSPSLGAGAYNYRAPGLAGADIVHGPVPIRGLFATGFITVHAFPPSPWSQGERIEAPQASLALAIEWQSDGNS